MPYTIKHPESFYIDGTWSAPRGSDRAVVSDPSNGAEITQVALGTSEDVDMAVRAAKLAFASWSETPAAERKAYVEKLQGVYKRRYEEMAALISLELGAPITMSRDYQADAGYGHAQGFLDAFDHFDWEEQLGNGDLIQRVPIGVVGLITPWNWPLNQIALKVVPALLTGCTCVLKPSEITPLSAMLYAEMIDEAGFPKGVFNLVNGTGTEVGATLSRHPDVAMMSFTGSTRAGIAVSKDAADTVKRVTLELGGKNPNIVTEDCDVSAAVQASVAECFLNSGQSCDAPSKFLIAREVYDQAVKAAKEAADATSVDLPSKEGDHIGPLVSKPQWTRVQALIQSALDEGATLISGGLGHPDGFEQGHFAKPTILADVTPDMWIYKEEIFGPVLTLTPFETDAQAIEMANDTAYGLAAYLQCADSDRAKAIARKLRAGMVHLNGAPFQYGSPFGGFGQSGNGREGGTIGLEDFTEVRVLHGAF
ncbi:MAG: aldehyde dehydrogenase family protein [Thalassovita sp.]